MNDSVVLTTHGYYELAEKPSQEELKTYYAEKYYQASQSTYAMEYSAAELRYFNAKLEQKHLAAQPLLTAAASERRFLDIGAGEGWALAYFSKQGWTCTGLDYSEFGCRHHNPEQLPNLVTGDIYDNLDRLAERGASFELILLDNVLEHVLDPGALLRQVGKLLAAGGVLVIEVPNDFSTVQRHLLDSGAIPRPFWVVVPDHISYFNHQGLLALCRSENWEAKCVMGDYPIDLSLFNPDTNYVTDKSRGKSCHKTRVEFENLLHSISPQKTNALYQALADLGLGRQIIGFFQRTP